MNDDCPAHLSRLLCKTVRTPRRKLCLGNEGSFKNAKLNSIHARFKGCMKNIRATPYKVGGDEFRALELYVASRGNGLSAETPSVRN